VEGAVNLTQVRSYSDRYTAGASATAAAAAASEVITHAVADRCSSFARTAEACCQQKPSTCCTDSIDEAGNSSSSGGIDSREGDEGSGSASNGARPSVRGIVAMDGNDEASSPLTVQLLTGQCGDAEVCETPTINARDRGRRLFDANSLVGYHNSVATSAARASHATTAAVAAAAAAAAQQQRQQQLQTLISWLDKAHGLRVQGMVAEVSVNSSQPHHHVI